MYIAAENMRLALDFLCAHIYTVLYIHNCWVYQPSCLIPVTGEIKIHYIISMYFLRIAECQKGAGELNAQIFNFFLNSLMIYCKMSIHVTHSGQEMVKK